MLERRITGEQSVQQAADAFENGIIYYLEHFLDKQREKQVAPAFKISYVRNRASMPEIDIAYGYAEQLRVGGYGSTNPSKPAVLIYDARRDRQRLTPPKKLTVSTSQIQYFQPIEITMTLTDVLPKPVRFTVSGTNGDTKQALLLILVDGEDPIIGIIPNKDNGYNAFSTLVSGPTNWVEERREQELRQQTYDTYKSGLS